MPKLRVDKTIASAKIALFDPASYEFDLSLNQRVSTVGGTTTDYDQQDAIFRESINSQVTQWNDVSVSGEVNPGVGGDIVYESKSPDVMTVDPATGVGTFVGNGTAKILARSPWLTKRILAPASISPSTTARTSIGVVAGSLAAHCNDQVAAAIDGLSLATNGPLFSSFPGSYARNASNWLTLAGVDVTCIGAGTRGSVLIAQQYGIQADHYQSSQDIYVDPDGNATTLTVASRTRIGFTDISVVRYTSAAPEDITPCKILPANAGNFIPGAITDYKYKWGLVKTDKEKKALVAGFATLNLAGSMYWGQPSDTDQQTFYEATVDGDSGSPVFALIGGELVLFCVTTSSFFGNVLCVYNSVINDAITAMGGGATVTTASLSAYPDYTAHNKLPKSSVLGASPWSAATTSATGGQASPDGANDAYLLQAITSSTSALTLVEFSSVQANQTYCFSVYAKAGNSNEIELLAYNQTTATTVGRVSFRFSDETITGSLGTVSVTDVGGGWYRLQVSVVVATVAGQSGRLYLYPSKQGTVVLGDNVYVWHPQVNLGTSPLGYQDTV